MEYNVYSNGNVWFLFSPEERRTIIKMQGLCRRMKEQAENVETEDYLKIAEISDSILENLNKLWHYDDVQITKESE